MDHGIELNIDESTYEFLLTGNLKSIQSNRRAAFFLKGSLNASFTEDSVRIPYGENNQRDKILTLVKDALKKYGLIYSDSNEIKDVLDDYYDEQEKFALFSQKAKAIWNNEVDAAEFESFTTIVSEHLVRALYPKQLLSAFHLAFSQHACNFSVPGAGKTSIVYAAYCYLKNLPQNHPKHVNRLLIVGPLSSFGPWEDEFEACFGQPAQSKRLSGGISKEERDRYLLSIQDSDDAELTLISYQGVPNDLTNLEHFLNRFDSKTMVVLDEAHRIKSTDGGVQASAVLQLAKYSQSRVVLTGTPVPNGYEDIYNLFGFIHPGRNLIRYNTFQLKEMSNKRFDNRIPQLIENLSPYFTRIRKSDLNLPPIDNHPPEMVEMGPVQRAIYDAIENQYLGYFENNLGSISAVAELSKARMIRLMQAATNPNLLKRPLSDFLYQGVLTSELFLDDKQLIEQIFNYHELEPVPRKFHHVKEMVSEMLEQGEKVLLWGVFIQTIKDLRGYLESNGIPSQVLIGEVPVDNDTLADNVVTREKIIKEFHSPTSSFNVLIANPSAVAESISLHRACHHAIYFERTFNAAHFIQSKDRIHRVGLPEATVTHYHYVLSKDSLDETIHQRLLEKERRMLELIESQDIPLFNENLDFATDFEDDIKALIRDYVARNFEA